MDHASAFTPTVLQRWRRRENLLPGLVLVAAAAAAWAYTLHQATSMDGTEGAMGGMVMSSTAEITLFLFGWTTMMVAMMVPATLPLILLYRTIARKRLSPVQARLGMTVLFSGYITVWAVAGLPVYAYNSLAKGAGFWRRCYRHCSSSSAAPTSSRRSSASVTPAAATRSSS